jgi:hypothetical protein
VGWRAICDTGTVDAGFTVVGTGVGTVVEAGSGTEGEEKRAERQPEPMSAATHRQQRIPYPAYIPYD